MKKFMMITIGLMILSVTTMAQESEPYVNVGTSVSNNQMYYTGEVGVYNNTSWYAVGVSKANGYNADWSASAKGYWKVSNRKKPQNVDVFATAAVNMTLTKQHYVSFEPGASLVYNWTKHWAPQVSLSFPIQENAVLRNRPLTTVAGVSLNYFF